MTEYETLDKLRVEFEDTQTTDERRAEIATEVQSMAPDSTHHCMACKQKVCYLPYDHGLIKGHIYSEMGISEFEISRFCEFCFDEVTAEPDEGTEELD